jgi:hypothetical protein
LVVVFGRRYSRVSDRNDQENQETIMEMPLVLQEKMLAGVDYQIRMAVKSLGRHTDDPLVISMCVAPWDIPGLFDLPTGDPTAIVDGYELRAICFGHYYASNAPEHDDWKVDIDDNISVPMFSPLDVWKAKQRHVNGDPGVVPPPITCETDRLLRNIRRGYEAPIYCLKELATKAHDWDVMGAALAVEGASVTRSLDELVAERVLWKTSTYLEGTAVGDYWDRYSQTPLASLRKLLNVESSGRDSFAAKWVSPSIIPLIASCEELRDRASSPQWLLYKAVTIHNCLLPEEQHNRMLAEAMNHDKYANAYFDFLKLPPTAALQQSDPVPERDYHEELRRLSYP